MLSCRNCCAGMIHALCPRTSRCGLITRKRLCAWMRAQRNRCGVAVLRLWRNRIAVSIWISRRRIRRKRRSLSRRMDARSFRKNFVKRNGAPPRRADLSEHPPLDEPEAILARMKILFGIDHGTTRTKALALDSEMRVVAQSASELPQIYPQPGWVEQHPADILRVTTEAITGCLAALPPGATVARRDDLHRPHRGRPGRHGRQPAGRRLRLDVQH